MLTIPATTLLDEDADVQVTAGEATIPAAVTDPPESDSHRIQRWNASNSSAAYIVKNKADIADVRR